ncbi:FKBP-type peptidyl-prolyl cis-trans isomerase fkpA precursor [Serratia entomophila]|uniref:FKBP-type peptidyl-prolyl cis-trans isomerase N-terminal domain-containing protein n=1 Tax=Serratia entomophila TaxID=42906 RepID=UPI0021788EE7|nr:FKBP-type peptidyl-prolyl cis-trans isomerase N-terminal domain-containing protein [Serratia entomophila]CAI1009479.1 FKBP-type peptidyl-prolyl cis-trans isomerase fkpA precursor [Serratia entomophila]CAI1136252.1 FKBP-type peptidyl-prolyl cis-trans isomerase fkpA precursor [Serratia entomophila]CAI2148462.1 FKBP-type peptidyl-prolyl cis-trans isomerase fkpA precursor [Serratia entomophila]
MTSGARLTLLGLVLPLMAAPATLYADDGVPALLQFAEQYQRQEPAPTPADKPQAAQGPLKKPATRMSHSQETAVFQQQQLAATRKALKEKEAQLQRQQTAMQSLQQELTALRAAAASNVAPQPDLAALSEFASGIRQALNLTPKERQAQALIAQAQAEAAAQKKLAAEHGKYIELLKRRQKDAPKQSDFEPQRLALQEKLTAAEKLNQQQRQSSDRALAAAAAELEQQKAESAKAIGELQQQLAQLQEKTQTQAGQIEEHRQQLARVQDTNAKSAQQIELANKRADKAEQALAAADLSRQQLRDELKGLRARAKLLPDGLTLKSEGASQTYAAGVALGRDIQTLLAERKNWGIDPDKTVLLAGIVDTFSGRYQLDETLLASSLAASEKAVNVARSKAVKEQETKGDAFVAEFSKKKGVKKSSSGFWYRVDYEGDEAIADDAQVDVVVKEMLIDGRVIQDMDRSGKVLSQPLSAYPPLFREAIGYLKNHGSLTMAVPPALAYGETGYPPQIPPNATMVYELRVVDVKKS